MPQIAEAKSASVRSEPSVSNVPSAYEQMLNELESNQLVVVLVPQKRHTNEGGMIRVAVSRNCNWYRKFCANNASSRKRRNAAFDTCIKRKDTIDALNAMIAGAPSSYHREELEGIARKFSTRP